MKNAKVTLAPLEAEDREQFILDNQESFKYGAVEKFGLRDDHFGSFPAADILTFIIAVLFIRQIYRELSIPDINTLREEQ